MVGNRIPMALDFIGVGRRGGEEGGWLAAEEGLAGGNPALPIGAIVRLWCPVFRGPAGKAGDLRQQSAVVITVTCNQIIMQTGHHANTSQ